MACTKTTLRVRYVETDQMGTAHHTSYFAWFEVGRTEYMRQHGFPYRHLEEEMGILLPVVDCRCRFLHTTRYDDLVTIRTTLRDVSRAKIVFEYEVVLAESGQRVAEGSSTHAFVDREGRPIHLSRQSPLWLKLQSLVPRAGVEGPAVQTQRS